VVRISEALVGVAAYELARCNDALFQRAIELTPERLLLALTHLEPEQYPGWSSAFSPMATKLNVEQTNIGRLRRPHIMVVSSIEITIDLTP
jgi:hypothetical protein